MNEMYIAEFSVSQGCYYVNNLKDMLVENWIGTQREDKSYSDYLPIFMSRNRNEITEYIEKHKKDNPNYINPLI